MRGNDGWRTTATRSVLSHALLTLAALIGAVAGTAAGTLTPGFASVAAKTGDGERVLPAAPRRTGPQTPDRPGRTTATRSPERRAPSAHAGAADAGTAAGSRSAGAVQPLLPGSPGAALAALLAIPLALIASRPGRAAARHLPRTAVSVLRDRAPPRTAPLRRPTGPSVRPALRVFDAPAVPVP